MKRPDAPDYVVGVVGTGAMGQGIAQVSATGEMRTLIFDIDGSAAAKARKGIAERFERLVEKGRMSTLQAQTATARIETADSVADLADCDAVIEAVFEDLEIKRGLFSDIEASLKQDCLIASNTSSIPIAAIARACERRDRIAGLHFFNPVPLMKLVEVIKGPETAESAVENLALLGKRMGRVPVVVKDAPGFLVNMGGRAYTTEALRISHESVASPAQIDAIMRDCCHFRMGPFELMDLTGIDVNYPVSQIVYDGYMQDPRIKTSPNHKALYEAGRFGRKSSAGWYHYDPNGQPLDRPSPDRRADCAPAARVSLAGPSERLSAFCAKIGLEVGSDDGSSPILAAPIGEDATHTALRTAADFRRLVALDLQFDTEKRVTLMTAPGAKSDSLDAVAAVIAKSGRKVTAIKDSPGFVTQRICAMIANLGCYMAEVGLASPASIDTAMKLGLNYPHGPLELAEEMGLVETHSILSKLQALTGEDRYRPTLWLSRRTALGLPVHTES